QAKEPPLPPDGRARIEIEHALPAWIVDELAAAVPADELAARAASFALPAPLVARVNRRKTTPTALVEHLAAAGVTATSIDLVDSALRLDGLGDPARSPSFMAGLWTVQDTGAQLVGHVAAPKPGMRILDACAGVGGKSTH